MSTAAIRGPVELAPSGDDTIEQLERLAQLHQQGILSDAEPTAANAKLLGI